MNSHENCVDQQNYDFRPEVLKKRCENRKNCKNFWKNFFRILSVGNLKKCFVITIFQMQKENIYNTLEEKKCSMKTAEF